MRSIKLLALILTVFGVQSAFAQQKSLEKIWETTEGIHVPESVLYHEATDRLYVSLIGQGGTDKGEIAILLPDGTVEDPHWITGLNAPKGLAIHKGLLYIADVTKIIVVDIVTSNIIDELPVEGAVFLNDVTVDDTGVVYISDTRLNKIYQLRNGKVTLYLDNVPSVNGLKYHKGNLLALAGKEFWSIDATKKVTVFTKGFEQGGDGLEPLSNGDFLVTCWPGLIYHVTANGVIHKIQDVQGKMNTADLGYNPKAGVIYIPTFNSNSVIAYKLK
ncbi:SMP-30/gluconolactonase/LRE family protein [Sphingobacterium bovistauri]|uniref:ATP-binding protein n=1 Tax=Sphingobacterium bovistauri TaxID=2781959 RepID=A0ABS7Z8Q8_9SPHI|nr:ATP-binding protein [Sphingobacterium bovistauri]MCA5005334.1 ATP-binding protein [Sphingobacterium bovistauri]